MDNIKLVSFTTLDVKSDPTIIREIKKLADTLSDPTAKNEFLKVVKHQGVRIGFRCLGS